MGSRSRKLRLGCVLIIQALVALGFSGTAVAAPSNDNVADAQVIVGSSGSIPGDNTGATAEPGEPSQSGVTPEWSVWYRWTAASSVRYYFNARSIADLNVAIYQRTLLGELELVGSDRDSGRTHDPVAALEATAGTTYLISVDGNLGGYYTPGLGEGPPRQAPFDLVWAPVASNDKFSAAVAVATEGGILIGNNLGSGEEIGDNENPFEDRRAGSMWYRFAASQTGYVRLTLSGDLRHGGLAAYTGTTVADKTLLATATSPSFEENEVVLSFQVNAGTDYHLRVTSVRGTSPADATPTDADQGVFTLTVEPFLRENQSAATAENLPGEQGSVSGTTEAAEESGVWYRWTAPYDAWFSFTLTITGSPENFPHNCLYIFPDDQPIVNDFVQSLASTCTDTFSPSGTIELEGNAGSSFILRVSGDTTVFGLSWEPVDIDLALTATGTEQGVTGEEGTYSFKVQNLSGRPGMNVQLRLSLPEGVALISATPTIGSCGTTDSALTCELGTIPGEQAVASVEVLVAYTTPGPKGLMGVVSLTAPDPNPSNDSAVAWTDVEGPACGLIGTAGDDVLSGGSGNDVICGLSGDDTIHGRNGDDDLRGGSGDDVLQGDADNDYLFGGDGDDRIQGGKGDNYIDGGQGTDSCGGNQGDSVVNCE